MTLVIAAQGKDFIVVGTDSKSRRDTVNGSIDINDLIVKLIPVSSHAAVLIFGASGVAQYMVDKFKSNHQKPGACITTLVYDLADSCREELRKLNGLPLNPNYLPYYGFIVAGLRKSGINFSVPKCYSIRSSSGFMPELYQEGFTIEGSSLIADYIFSKKYRSDMTIEELTNLVALTLYETSTVDGNVGGKFKMALIDSKGLREFDNTSIRKMIEE